MLLSLHIENIAVIKSADIDFSKGFTVLSGQTGAGKSIILDSINLLLGAKADRELVRHGEAQAVVEGLFANLSDNTVKLASELGVPLDEDGKMLIHRTLSADGKSQIRINGRSSTLAMIRMLAPSLISIHGQSDTNSLVDPSRHIELVDIYAENAELLEEYGKVYSDLEGIRSEIEEIKQKAQESDRLKEILAYQIRDIDSLALHDGEEEELVDKKVKIRNSEKITKNAEFVYKALKGSEKGSVSYLLDRSITSISAISGVVPDFAQFAERLRDILYQIDDIAEEAYALIEDIDTDPTEALNRIESRLDKISKIKRKYGFTIAEVLAFRDRAREEYNALENSEELLGELSRKEALLYDKALAIADMLHERRVSALAVLESRVKETLEFLDMPKVVFFADIKERELDGRKLLNKSGSDILEFYLSANLGADAQPMAKIASGGELARVMLALKSVITDKDGVSTVIFDEIDAGVSGKTARKIGIKMLELSRNTQLLCVTHSAQIASLADNHLLISKSEVDGTAQTQIATLDFDGRVSELSRILGGINVTDSQRQAALDMLNERN